MTLRLKDVVFDGSTWPGRVFVNGIAIGFSTDADARAVFAVLTEMRNEIDRLNREAKLVEQKVEELSKMCWHNHERRER